MMEKTEKVDDISSVTVSAKVLSRILGVCDRRIRMLAQEGILVKASQGRYKLEESLHNYILNLRVANDANKNLDLEDELNLDVERAKHERVKRHMSELKYALMKGDVHKSEDVKVVMTNMLTNFKSKILGLPSKLTPQLIQRDKAYVEEILTNEMNEALIELSEYNAADFYGKEFVDANLEEEEENEL